MTFRNRNYLYTNSSCETSKCLQNLVALSFVKGDWCWLSMPSFIPEEQKAAIFKNYLSVGLVPQSIWLIPEERTPEKTSVAVARTSSASPIFVYYIFWFIPRMRMKVPEERTHANLQELVPIFSFIFICIFLDNIPHFLTEGTLKSDTNNQRPWCKEMSWNPASNTPTTPTPCHTHTHSGFTHHSHSSGVEESVCPHSSWSDPSDPWGFWRILKFILRHISSNNKTYYVSYSVFPV